MPSPAIPPYIDAVPINAITAFGFGPLGGRMRDGGGPEALRELQNSRDGRRLAVETIGITGTRVLVVLAAFDGSLPRAEFAAQTAGANPAELAAAMARATAAGLVTVAKNGLVTLEPHLVGLVDTGVHSLADPQAATNDDLAVFCRLLDVAVPKTKSERVQAVAAAFDDPEVRARVRDELSEDARDLLHALAELPVLHTMPASMLGLQEWELRVLTHRATAMRYSGSIPTLAALNELGMRGVLGADPHAGVFWVWREAWPLLERPLVIDWTVAERPPIVAHRAADAGPTPAAVGLLDALLARWRDLPPGVLKNALPRISRPDARATAKALGSDDATVDLLARLAISMRLVLRNEVSRRGRGRTQRIEEVWKPDPDLTAAWADLPAHHRWGRLVAEWCSPRTERDAPLLANRHLVLWELQRLDTEQAYAGDAAFAAWMGDHYAPIGDPATIADCLVELRALGIVTPNDVALTERGRAILTDPIAAVTANAGESTRAFVQADLTVIAPPDLRHDLVLLLDRIATVQSSGGATIYRLDAHRIAKAVQAGDTAESIIDGLRDLAGADLPDTVTRLVQDAAARAGAVQLITAATVVIVDDPADLSVACAIKALRLTRISPTVAATDVAVAKVQAALEAKRLAPKVISVHDQPTKSASAHMAKTEELIARLREASEGRGGDSFLAREAARLEAGVKAMADFDARLAVPAALTLTPAAAAALATATSDDSSAHRG